MSMAHLEYVRRLVAWYQLFEVPADTTTDWVVLPSTQTPVQFNIVEGSARIELANGLLPEIEQDNTLVVPILAIAGPIVTAVLGGGALADPSTDFRQAPWGAVLTAAPTAFRIVTPPLITAKVSALINADHAAEQRDRRHSGLPE